MIHHMLGKFISHARVSTTIYMITAIIFAQIGEAQSTLLMHCIRRIASRLSTYLYNFASWSLRRVLQIVPI